MHFDSCPTAVRGLRTPWFRMSPPIRRERVRNATQLIVIPGDGSMSISGETTLDGVKCADGPGAADLHDSFELSIPAAKSFFHKPMTTVRNGQYLLTLYIYRLVTGGAPSLQINGKRGLSGRALLSGSEWQMIVNVSQCTDADASVEGLFITGGESSGTLRVAGAAVLAFDTLRESVAFANASRFPAIA